MADEKEPKLPPLTARQRMFIAHYLVCWNQTEAARLAGFAVKNRNIASTTFHRPQVQFEIRRRVAEIEAKLQLDATEIQAGFARIATDSRSPANGGPSVSERIAALRELGKLKGMYVERHVFTGKSLEELLQEAGQKEQEQAAAKH